MRQFYIAGPMRGIPYYNFPLFDEARDKLKEVFPGDLIVSPADLDRAAGFALSSDDQDWDEFPSEIDFRETAKRDLNAVVHADYVVVLPGWEQSRGALAEVMAGVWTGSTILDYPDLEELDIYLPKIDTPTDESVLAEAERLVNGDRQNQYGPPDQDFRRTAGMWRSAFGWDVEPFQVALAMILLKVSRQTHQRKRDNWTDIAGYADCGHRCDIVAQQTPISIAEGT